MTGVSAYSRHFLECAFQDLDIDAFTMLGCLIHANPVDVDTAVGTGLVHGSGWKQDKDARIASLLDIADAAVSGADKVRREILVAAGLISVRWIIDEVSEVLARWAITDAAVGGCMEPFRRPGHYRLTRSDDLTLRLSRRLVSPKFIKRYVRSSDTADAAVKIASRAARRYVSVGSPPLVMPVRWGELYRDLRNANAIASPSIRARRASPRFRKILSAAATTAAAVIGTTAVSALARGDTVRVDGPTASVDISRLRGSSLGDVGHGALSVSMVDPASGAKLADLCVYVPGVPALDQVTCVALHVQSGDEADVLRSANLVSVTDAGFADPLISRRAEQQGISRLVNSSNDVPGYERVKRAADRYWEDTGRLWKIALARRALGRNMNLLLDTGDSHV